MRESQRPTLRMIADDAVERVVGEALRVLAEVGIVVESPSVRELLSDGGGNVSDDGRVRIPETLCLRCLETAPDRFELQNLRGTSSIVVGGDDVCFDPGSAALTLHEPAQNHHRPATTRDVIDFVRIVDALPPYGCQSTGLVPSDVPADIADRYRLLLSLVFASKPIVTGTFTPDGFDAMWAFLVSARGSRDELRRKPLAIFDCCPTSPLTWSVLAVDALVRCAEEGVPVEIVSTPMAGATAPATLAGTLVQHAAEDISGVVIHQLARPGAPVVFGGAPAVFDMRHATAPYGSIETMMIGAAYTRVGKKLGLPVHSYMGLSDSKTVDYQAGMETAMGATLAALAGVNVVSGAGILNYIHTQSLEKLVLDAETCASLSRLLQGIGFADGEEEALGVLKARAADRAFLGDEHTRRHYRGESYFPSNVIDRATYDQWTEQGSRDSLSRARARVNELRAAPVESALSTGVIDDLERLFREDARKLGARNLPDWRSLLS